MPGIAVPDGVSLEECEALKDWRASGMFSEAERAALAYVDAMIAGPEVPDAVFEAVRKHYGEREVVELTVLAGTYIMHNRVFSALKVDLERTEHPVEHDVGAGQDRQLDGLSARLCLRTALNTSSRRLGPSDHSIDIGQRRALGLAEQAGGAPVLQRLALLKAHAVRHGDPRDVSAAHRHSAPRSAMRTMAISRRRRETWSSSGSRPCIEPGRHTSANVAAACRC